MNVTTVGLDVDISDIGSSIAGVDDPGETK